METCENCKFHTVLTDSKEKVVDDANLLCRRYPPSVLMVPVGPTIANPKAQGLALNSFFPMIGKQHWCGEWRPLAETAANDTITKP